MKIFLMRHGESTGDIEDRYGGDYDDHLTQKGKEQAKNLAEKLVGKDIQLIYHSPRHRAKETAGIVSEKLDIPKKEVNALRERNGYGILTGMTKNEAKQKYPEQVRELAKGRFIQKVKGSEHYEPFKERVVKIFQKITNETQYDTIAIITHGGVCTCIINELLEKDSVALEDCSIMEIEKEDGNLKIVNTDGVIIK